MKIDLNNQVYSMEMQHLSRVKAVRDMTVKIERLDGSNRRLGKVMGLAEEVLEELDR